MTVEAFASAKAVITRTDSGGPLEFVRVRRERPRRDARWPGRWRGRLRRSQASAALAERLGAQATPVVARLTWAEAVKQLVIV